MVISTDADTDAEVACLDHLAKWPMSVTSQQLIMNFHDMTFILWKEEQIIKNISMHSTSQFCSAILRTLHTYTHKLFKLPFSSLSTITFGQNI